MLGFLVTANEDLDLRFFLALLLHPFGEFFLRHGLPHYDVRSVVADIYLNQVSCSLGEGLIAGFHRKFDEVIDLFLLEGGGDEEENDEDKHDVDHARDIDDLALLGVPAANSHNSVG